jgi:hypothetical protein
METDANRSPTAHVKGVNHWVRALPTGRLSFKRRRSENTAQSILAAPQGGRGRYSVAPD